ncbi:MAG TPA: glycosyltransferase family 9 protein [Candidatus Limnocylindrales bacterium]|nr:glycosyltransferase family 9 protein [Candidatus Limnocylindrales bacterium]
MISTSCKDIAQELLDQCVAGTPPQRLPRTLLAEPCGKALFGVLVEGLADRFEPALCDVYARLFSQAVEYAVETVDAASLVARYNRVRKVRPVMGKPRRIFVLSRVTLGADVAVTSVLMAAAKRRFPHAEIVFVGPQKNYELFGAEGHIHHAPLPYTRGGLRDRLAAWQPLRDLIEGDDCLVVDPDSRLTQLGLLPVCAEERYHLFESRAYGADTSDSLPQLAAKWARETFGVADAKPFIALGGTHTDGGHIAISLGVGENPAKRIADPFEEKLLGVLAESGAPLCIDEGAGGEESERVRAAVERAGVNAVLWSGSFAGFARIIAASKLYVGYDSAGQHIAAACGVPLVSIFGGFPVPRMFDRWRPVGANVQVVRVEKADAEETLERVREALVGTGLPAGTMRA